MSNARKCYKIALYSKRGNHITILFQANSIPAGYVPDIPSAPDVATVHLPTLNKLGEPTFDSLGLGNFSPVGLMQNIMEFVHVSVDIPWWGCLAVSKWDSILYSSVYANSLIIFFSVN